MKRGSDNKLVRDSTQSKIGSFTFLTSIQVSNSDQNQIADFLNQMPSQMPSGILISSWLGPPELNIWMQPLVSNILPLFRIEEKSCRESYAKVFRYLFDIFSNQLRLNFSIERTDKVLDMVANFTVHGSLLPTWQYGKFHSVKPNLHEIIITVF